MNQSEHNQSMQVNIRLKQNHYYTNGNALQAVTEKSKQSASSP